MRFARAVLILFLVSAVSPAWAQVDGRARVISEAEAHGIVAHYRSIPGNGVVKGEGRVVRDGEARSIVDAYKSIPGNGVVKGEGRVVRDGEARSIVDAYKSIPGNGVVKGEGRVVRDGEARSIVDAYKSIPGNGVVKGEGRVVRDGEARSIVDAYKSIPGNGVVKGEGRVVRDAEAHAIVKAYKSIPGNGVVKGEGRVVKDAEAHAIVKTYKSVPGGLVLEGNAAGMQWVKKARYQPASNSFVLNDNITFASPISASSAAVLIRSIMQDDKIGVSLTDDTQIAYGKLPDDSNVAADLRLADVFLGDLILPPRDWTIGYRLADGFKPREDVGAGDVSVFFRFRDVAMEIKDGKLVPERASFDAIVVPVVDSKADDGGFLPDFKAIANPAELAAYETNAKHVATHIGYYLREPIVARAYAYGQTVAFLRSLKAAGINLRELARSLERAGKAAGTSTSAADDVDEDWQTYLKQIQDKNDYANWSSPPYDAYRQRKELASLSKPK